MTTDQIQVAGGPGVVMIEFYGGYQVYSESGIDLTLLRRNLQLTVSQRWLQQAQCQRSVAALVASVRGGPNGPLPGTRRSVMLDSVGILRQLTKGQVDFVVIGGLAMTLNGSAYITNDVDVCYSRTPQNIARLAAALEPLHLYLRGVPQGLPFRFDVATIQAGLNFTLTTDLGDLDVLGEVSGIGFYDQVLAMSEEKEVYGLKVRVLSLDGLVAAKKAAGRTKDKLHLLELEELKKLRDEGAK